MNKISFKEKQAIFSALQAAQHAEADVSLLEQKQPSNTKLRAYKKFATMKANEILYDLLEVATREEIVKNRRDFGKSAEQLAKEEAERIAAEKKAAEKAAKEEAKRIAAEKAAAEKADKEEAARIASEKAKKEATEQAAKEQELEDLKAEHEELKSDHDALQEERSVLEDENNQLQGENEELQEQNGELADQLEAEKKKEQTPKPVTPSKPAKAKPKASPKKRSTRR